jgi:hypothetical protein
MIDSHNAGQINGMLAVMGLPVGIADPEAVADAIMRVGELLDDLLTEHKVNGRRSQERAKYSVAHLRGFFGDARAQTLDQSLVRAYIRPPAGRGGE